MFILKNHTVSIRQQLKQCSQHRREKSSCSFLFLLLSQMLDLGVGKKTESALEMWDSLIFNHEWRAAEDTFLDLLFSLFCLVTFCHVSWSVTRTVNSSHNIFVRCIRNKWKTNIWQNLKFNMFRSEKTCWVPAFLNLWIVKIPRKWTRE